MAGITRIAQTSAKAALNLFNLRSAMPAYFGTPAEPTMMSFHDLNLLISTDLDLWSSTLKIHFRDHADSEYV